MGRHLRATSFWAVTIALYGAAFVVLAWPWLSGAVTIPWDAKAQFYPQLQFLAASLAKGESPFWAPHVFAGWPQIADPQSLIFSLPHLLLAFFNPGPSFRAADAVTFASLFVGGLGVILLFRQRGWHAGGALVAALMFAFGGSAASRLQHTGQIMSLAYLPLALWLTARALDRASGLSGIAAGIAIGLLALGRDQVALLGLYLLAGYVVWHWADRPPERFRASLAPLFAAALAAVCIAALPLVVTALLTADSNRPAIDFISAGRGSLHPAHLLTLLFADLYGAASPAVDYWGPPSFDWKVVFGPTDLFLAQNMGQLYAGALAPIAIIGIGFVRGLLWARDIRFFACTLLLLLLYAVGWHTPAFRVLYELLPGVSLFRRPADATFVVGLLLAIVTGYLVHRWLSGTVPRAEWWQRTVEVGIALFAVVATAALAHRAGKLDVAILPILTGVAFFVAAVFVLAVTRGMAAHRPLAATMVLAAFVMTDLFWSNGPNESSGLPPAMYDALRPATANDTVTLLKEKLSAATAGDRRDRVELIGIAYHWPNLSLAHGLDHVLGHNPLRLRDFARATGVGDTVATADQRTFSPLFPSYRSTMADLLGLRLIATGVPVEQIDSSLRPGDLDFIARTKEAYVYENPRVLPRTMLVQDYRVVDFDEVIRSGWPNVDPRRTVLLERAPQRSFDTSSEAKGTARIVRYANTEVVIEVDAPAGGLLLLNDMFHPWWRAEVDGKQVPILRANVLFRAVEIGPEQHRVRFVFSPFIGAFEQVKARLSGALRK